MNSQVVVSEATENVVAVAAYAPRRWPGALFLALVLAGSAAATACTGTKDTTTGAQTHTAKAHVVLRGVH